MNEDILLKTWKLLIYNACDNYEICGDRYRRGQVRIGEYVPVEARYVPELMGKWVAFYNSEEFEDVPLIKAGLLHYAFESIHPFCDGNGRLGRLLFNNYLISRGIKAMEAVSISMQIDATRSKYDVAFFDSENIYNDCTPLITYLLETLFAVCREAIEVNNLKC